MIDLEKLEKEIDKSIESQKQETGFNTLGTLAQKEFLRLIKEQNNRFNKS